MADLYAILGVARNGSPDDVRRAYKRAALASHPDKHPDDPTAAERFKRVTKAYAVLGDEAHRAAYDAQQRHRHADESHHGDDGGVRGGEDGDEDDFFSSLFDVGWEDIFNTFPSNAFYADMDEDMDEEATARMQVRESTFVRRVFTFAVIAALTFSAFHYVPALAQHPLLFPGPMRLENRRFANDVALGMNFRSFVAHLKTQHVNSISGGALLHKLGILGGRLLPTHTPFLLLHYDNHDLMDSPWFSGSEPWRTARARILSSRRKVGRAVYELFTYVQLAGEDENGPPRWPRTEDADMCVRLLKSGTVTHLEWFPHVSVHLYKSRGPFAKLRSFGFTVVKTDACVRSPSVLAVALCLLLGYIAARYLV